MRYTAEYKQEKRKELLKISGQLAKKNGFGLTGVDHFMKAAGVTSGAFYSHFASKQDLFKALIQSEITRSLKIWANNPHQNAEDWLDFELQRYLNLTHVHYAEQGCVVPALANEVARSANEIKQIYQQELMRGHALFTQHLGSEQHAWAVLCQLMGSILMARTIVDESLQLQILDASKTMLKLMLKHEIN